MGTSLAGLAAFILASAALVAGALPPAPDACTAEVRSSINWGTATSAYQIEGGWDADDKSPSIWDTLTHISGKIADNRTGDVACDHFHKWQQDIALMKSLGVKHYRLSISWPRVIPGGTAGSPVSEAGIAFYRNLIKALLEAGIKPAVTMYHWDLPQVLQDKYGGFMSPRIQADFLYYADTLFAHLGDLVTQWMTFNEVISICELGYQLDVFAPQWQAGLAAKYTCGHNVILAHAKTVQMYRKKYIKQGGQKGRISIALDGKWGYPKDPTNPKDVAAADAFMQFQYAWIADPLYRGDYPPLMRATQGTDLPTFTPAEKQLLKATKDDFFAVNFYCGYYISAPPEGAPKSMTYDTGVSFTSPGEPSNAGWLFKSPDGLRKTLAWLHKRYDGPEFWITENGVSGFDEETKPLPEVLRDSWRQGFYSSYLHHMCLAKTQDGVNVKNYYAWSFMDNFEWRDGFSKRFGLVYVDLEDPQLSRHPKDSALWLSKYFFNAPAAAKTTRAVTKMTLKPTKKM